MQYSTTEGVQGIAPAGFHIPTHSEYKTLEMFLGMTQEQANAILWRGTTEGDQLKSAGLCQGRTPCATGNFNALFGGYSYGGGLGGLNSMGFFWTSSQNGVSVAWYRYLYITYAQSGTYYGFDKTVSFSVRALKN